MDVSKYKNGHQNARRIALRSAHKRPPPCIRDLRPRDLEIARAAAGVN
jgi:hypothetical protein